MRPLLLAAAVALAIASSPLAASNEAHADDGCGRITVYSGPEPVDYNPGSVCGMAPFLMGDTSDSACNAFMDWLVGAACPADTTAQPVDTRFILPSDDISVGYVGFIAGEPTTLGATLDGLGYVAEPITLTAHATGPYWESAPFPYEGSGELWIRLALPDGTTLTTVYRTLDVA